MILAFDLSVSNFLVCLIHWSYAQILFLVGFASQRGSKRILPGMGEIGNIGDLNLRNYCISFCSRNININNYCISFLKMSLFEVRNVKIKSIQVDTKWYLFKISQSYIIKCFSSRFVLNFGTQNDIKPIILYSK
jgi:hypothetical protein